MISQRVDVSASVAEAAAARVERCERPFLNVRARPSDVCLNVRQTSCKSLQLQVSKQPAAVDLRSARTHAVRKRCVGEIWRRKQRAQIQQKEKLLLCTAVDGASSDEADSSFTDPSCVASITALPSGSADSMHVEDDDLRSSSSLWSSNASHSLSSSRSSKSSEEQRIAQTQSDGGSQVSQEGTCERLIDVCSRVSKDPNVAEAASHEMDVSDSVELRSGRDCRLRELAECTWESVDQRRSAEAGRVMSQQNTTRSIQNRLLFSPLRLVRLYKQPSIRRHRSRSLP